MARPYSLQRTLIIAPHPDDDAIAAGGLMQRVLASGGDLRVLFVTDGQNNPWPQRLMQRKWFLHSHDRAAWGATRRKEALDSLAVFGIPRNSADFLGLPDSGLAAMARRGDDALAQRLRSMVMEWQPTLIVSPSMLDLHPDHRAVSYFTLRTAPEAAIITYVVHGKGRPDRVVLRLALSEGEMLRKREAIEQHRSQLALSRRRFLAYAREHELFYRPDFDIVRIESAGRETLIAIEYAARVMLGLDPAPEGSAPPVTPVSTAPNRSR